MKAQVDIISALLIIVIALTLFGSAYTFLKPVLEKRQHAFLVEHVRNAFDQLNPSSLPSKIESVAKLGGEETFSLNVKGIWTLNPEENYIEFSFVSRVSNIAEGIGWISLTPGENCSAISPGKIGEDRMSVVCAKAEKKGNLYQITYRLFYRKLEDPVTGREYELKLVQHPAGSLRTTSRSLRISKGEVTEEQVDDKTLITTQMKILLV